MKPVRWGIISTARHGWEKVIPSMKKSADIEIAAISSRDEERAKHWAKELGIPRAYGSYDALLADPDIEAVFNPLPNHLHVPLTLAAAKAGKHVLCEKPMAMNAAEAEGLRAAPKGILIAEAFMLRHHPQWKEVSRLVQSGAVGDIRAIQCLLSFFLVDPDNVRNKADIGGGAILDLGCYPTVVSRYVYGTEPQRVVSLVERDPKLKIDRLTTVIVDFGEGRRLDFTVSSQLIPYERVNIYGTKGRIEVVTPFGAPLGEATHIVIDKGSKTGLYKGRPRWDVGGVPEDIPIEACDQYQLQAEAFGRAVRGIEPLAYGVEDAICNMRVLDAVFRSAETGRWENVQR